LVVPSGAVEKIPPDVLQRTEDEGQARRHEAVSEILCDMLMAAVSRCGDDPSLGEKVREP
jgi:hypothetical protein